MRPRRRRLTWIHLYTTIDKAHGRPDAQTVLGRPATTRAAVKVRKVSTLITTKLLKFQRFSADSIISCLWVQLIT